MSIWNDGLGLRPIWVLGGIILGAVLLGLVVLFGVARPIETRACRIKAEGLGFSEYDYGLSTGCRVKVDGRWLPLDNVRFTEPTR